MKWASNKRLHLEIASLKAIQNLNEIRLTDVISAIGKADPGEIANSFPKGSAAPPAEPKPHPTPEKKTVTKDSKLDPIDRLIADAPEDAVEPEPIQLNPDSKNPKQKPIDQAKAEENNPLDADEFHNDPLIVEALKVFKGRLIS